MVKKANVSQVQQIFDLISMFARKELLLPRSRADIYEHIRDFFVFSESTDDGERVVGCCALHIIWEDLAEIRSLAVANDCQKEGIGSQLVLACIEEAKELGLSKVFALTYVPVFFEKMGFKLIDKHQLPRKIWKDCINCPYFPDCEEQAVVIELRRK